MITFNIQDQVVGGGVADEALGGEAPEVDLGVQLGGEADAASRHDHAATGTQAELLQQLEAEIVFSQQLPIFVVQAQQCLRAGGSAYLAAKVSVLVQPDLLQLSGFLHFLDAHHFDVPHVTRQRHHEPRVSVSQAEVDLLLLRKQVLGSGGMKLL